MKKVQIFLVLVFLLTGHNFLSCSNNEKAESEKGTIESMTDKVAKEAVDKIRTPIEKAHAVKKQQAERFSAMEDSTKNQ